MEGTALQRRVFRLLENFEGLDPLRRLFWSELNYDRENAPLSRRGWSETVSGVLAEDPVVFAAGADGGFEVIHCRLDSAKLSLQAERRVMEKLHAEGHDRALFVFSDTGRVRWHFVNARYSTEEGRRRLYRRIAVGPEEEHRTASERIAMLDLDGLEGASALDIQARHDEAFAVEPVTNEFFREYARVFARVESLIEGIAEDATERRRLFTQRLFNRLMFLAFIQKKGWLRFDGDANYLPALWKAYRRDEHDENFYRDRLKLLFFTGLNTPNEVDVAGINNGGYTSEIFGDVPYLNGGLFEKGDDDRDDAIVVPDAAIKTIFEDLFGRFNFTVTESTPLDVEVAVDPEMLGRVFKELVTGRHETGSYYTPKPIVSFMCREALKGHLGARLPHDSPEAVKRFVEEHDPSGLRNPEGALEALRNVTVCDPACGSGAYLLGMLHELLGLRERLFAVRSLDSISNYERKLEIIQKNLYGVDIDTFAVNIARLRLWLSLVVDFEGKDGQKPPPLPNLDFKIETGDSLTAPDPSGGSQVDLARGTDIRDFYRLKDEYLRAHGEEKRRLKVRIDEMRRKLSDWLHPGREPEGFDWQVEFAEVFAGGEDGSDRAGGFDVILANPPYVRQELIKELKPALKSVFPEVYTGTSDLYVFFYARALQLLRPGGMLSFISSNKWFRANYGAKLRKHVADTTHVASITDFGDLPVFQSATAYPMIFVAQKGRNEIGGPTVLTQVKALDPPYPDVAALIQKSGQPLPSDALDGPDWSLTDAATATHLRKMKAAGIPLGEYVKGRIYYGIKTGFNKAFYIDAQKRDALISQDPNSEEILRPLAVGKNIKRWVVQRDQWQVFTPIGVPIKRYPAVFEHLKQWQPELEKRYDKGRHWWELRACDYYEAFDKPKIMYPILVKNRRFAFDPAGSVTNDKAFVIPIDDLYLLGVLNSTPAWGAIAEICSKLRGGFYEMRAVHLSKVPIPNAPATDRDAVAGLVQKCLDARGVGCEEWEAEIDGRGGGALRVVGILASGRNHLIILSGGKLDVAQKDHAETEQQG